MIRTIAFGIIATILVLRLAIIWSYSGDNSNLRMKMYKSLQWILGFLLVTFAIYVLDRYGWGIGSTGVTGSGGSGNDNTENINQVFSTQQLNTNANETQENDSIQYYTPPSTP